MIAVINSYAGLSPDEVAARITSPFERATTQGTTLVFAESVDRSPADVPAAQAIGVGLPQRIRGQLSVTTAAEALDNERLHGLIFVGPGRSSSPDRGRGL